MNESFTWKYTHESGLEFDLALISGHDMTAILFYYSPEADDIECAFVDCTFGWPESEYSGDMDPIDAAIEVWLKDKDLATLLASQKLYRESFLDKD